MNKQLQTVLSEEEQFQIQEELLKLLARQTRKYTSGDSSSVPVEIGQELMDSIFFCIGVGLQGKEYMGQIDRRLLLDKDLASMLDKGIAYIRASLEYGERLWNKICMSLPKVENRSMKDTLKSIGTFWKNYDYRFFAHEIPCDIDYQLSIPVSEQKKGVLYVLAYLERLAVENHFLSYFEEGAMLPVLNRYCPDYEGLLINLYEPIATNAIGCALLQKDFKKLGMTSEEQQELVRMFENISGKAIENKLVEASEWTLEQLSCQSPREQQLLKEYAKELAVRIESVRDMGGISGIFL